MKSRSIRDKKIIYDIGANNGDDVVYYLKKADLVVAVEANPILCEQIRSRFPAEIETNRLVVTNCVLTADEKGPQVPFYINRENHVLSQFPAPKYKPERFEKVILPAMTVPDLFETHGQPYYVKIDLERYDHVIVRALLNNRILPDYLSVEAHQINVFSLLSTLGGYDRFKIVEGSSIADLYRDWPIETLEGRETYSFQHHSAGPFGEDVAGDWMNPEQVFKRLLAEDVGWKDIHAKKGSSGESLERPASMWRLGHWVYLIRWFCSRRGSLCKFLGRVTARMRRVANLKKSL